VKSILCIVKSYLEGTGAIAYIEHSQDDHLDEIEPQAIKIILSLEGRQVVCLDKQ
jgi:hypothetical protein